MIYSRYGKELTLFRELSTANPLISNLSPCTFRLSKSLKKHTV